MRPDVLPVFGFKSPGPSRSCGLPRDPAIQAWLKETTKPSTAWTSSIREEMMR